jgi:hypothetical protein
MNTAPTLFTKAAALMLAAQNTADDGDWVYKAEPVQGNTAQLYKVAIYDEAAQLLGYL